MAEKSSSFFRCVNPCNIEWQKFLNDSVKLDKSKVIEKLILNDMGECEECKIKFAFFRKKKFCSDCGLGYCGSCLIGSTGGKRQCNKCTIFSHWPISVDEVSSLRVRDLRHFLNSQKINTHTIREKRDLVDLVVHHLKICHEKKSRNNVNLQSENIDITENKRSTNIASSTSAFIDDGIRVQPLTAVNFNFDESSSDITNNSEVVGIRVFASSNSEENPEREKRENQDSSDDSSSDWSFLLSDLGPERLPIDSSSTSNNGRTASASHVNESSNNTNAELGGAYSSSQEKEYEDINCENVREIQNEVLENIDSESTQNETTTTTESHPTTSFCMTAASDVVKLSSIENEETIKNLSVRQCKEVLILHRVDYSGIWEKHELVNKVKTLWQDYRIKQETKEINDEQLCKICMDAIMDCVLLECGHIVSCTECGKQMSECPVCRQNVLRVVKTFRA